MSKFQVGDLVLVVSEHYEPDIVSHEQAVKDFSKTTGYVPPEWLPVPTASPYWWWMFPGSDGCESDPSYDPGVSSIGIVHEVWPDMRHPAGGDVEGDPQNPDHQPNWYTCSVSFLHSRNHETKYKPSQGEGFYSFNDMDLLLITPARLMNDAKWSEA